MTNREKLKEVFPYTIFIYRKEDDKTNAIMCTDEWLDSEYIEPTTKNDLGVDCISRDDVRDVMQELWGTSGELMDRLMALPSVTPQEPKTGHWISTETKGVRYAFWCRYKCSLCGGLSARTNFCPNCGCRMVEPQESEIDNGNDD
ncbi:MAG: hypothetical protein IKE94_10760 [Aeriscardovia sp.]|nr:hypothetical protein [Aeriscardovia sp.]